MAVANCGNRATWTTTRSSKHCQYGSRFNLLLSNGMKSDEEKCFLTKRNASVSLLLECALLFLASAVFTWGLQAKVALNHANQNRSASISSMAKLLIENNSTRAVTAVGNLDRPRITRESLHFAAFAFSPQGHHVSAVNVSQAEPRPRIPGRYNLHHPDATRRPPPVIS
jgi:hypothetical protein